MFSLLDAVITTNIIKIETGIYQFINVFLNWLIKSVDSYQRDKSVWINRMKSILRHMSGGIL